MSAQSMADVVAGHRHNEGIDLTGRIYTWCMCEGLDGWRVYGMSGPRAYAEHLQDALSAAGFGLVTDAKAEALNEAADEFTERVTVTRQMTKGGTDYEREVLQNASGMAIAATALRARAEAVRGE